MQEVRRNLRSWLAGAARFFGLHGWLIAALGVPLALLMGSLAAVLLVLLVAFTWQALALALIVLFPPHSDSLKQTRRFNLTRWGFLYCLVTGLLCLLAIAWGINLFVLTASFLLGGLVCSAIFCLLTLSEMDAGWEYPRHIFAGMPFSMRLRLRNEKRFLPAHALRIEGGNGRPGNAVEHCVPRLAPEGEISVSLRQSLPDRGPQPLPPAVVRSGFPFGLIESKLVARQRREVLVLPRMGRIYNGQLLHYTGREAPSEHPLRQRDQQGEFRSMREYTPGDDPRYIHWPTSARLRKLHVKEFERRAAHSVLILLDASAPRGHADGKRGDRFEQAVSFVATLAAMLTRQSNFYAFASLCPDLVTLPYGCSRGHLFALLEALARAEMTPDHSVDDLLASLSPGEQHEGACLVTPGPHPAERVPLGADSSAIVVDASTQEFHEYFSTGI